MTEGRVKPTPRSFWRQAGKSSEALEFHDILEGRDFSLSNIFRVTDHGASHRRIFDDVVLLNYSQDVAPEFPHLAVVLLDHFCTSGDV